MAVLALGSASGCAGWSGETGETRIVNQTFENVTVRLLIEGLSHDSDRVESVTLDQTFNLTGNSSASHRMRFEPGQYYVLASARNESSWIANRTVRVWSGYPFEDKQPPSVIIYVRNGTIWVFNVWPFPSSLPPIS